MENRDKLKLVSIDNEKGAGPVLPTPETIANGTYQPLARPIFIYVKQAALERPEVREFPSDTLFPFAVTRVRVTMAAVGLPAWEGPRAR